MKGNRKFIRDIDAGTDPKMIGGLVALLATIIVCVLVYFSVNSTMAPSTYSEKFYGYSATQNASITTITLTYSPYSTTNSTMTLVCYNSTGLTQYSPAKTISIADKKVVISADASVEFTQINVSYTPMVGSTRGTVDTTAGTVFALLPVIAVIIVGGILIALVVGFTGRKGV